MLKADVIELFNGPAALGRYLGISSQAISQWPEEVPELQQYRLREKDARIDRKLAALRRKRVRKASDVPEPAARRKEARAS